MDVTEEEQARPLRKAYLLSASRDEMVDKRDLGNYMAEVQAVRNMMSLLKNWVLFDPLRAWTVTEDARSLDYMSATNRVAMFHSDVVIALAPQYVNSPVVWQSVRDAYEQGIPVYCWRPTWLQEKNAPTGAVFFETVTELVAEVHDGVYPRASSPAPIAKWTGPEEFAPRRGHPDDAGFDLTYSGTGDMYIPAGGEKDLPCSVAIQFPPNTWGFLVGRSSTFRNRGLLVNPAVIDPGYRGELWAIVRNISNTEVSVRPGERIAQIVPLPALAGRMDLRHVDELDSSARGTNGFGSTGK